MRLGLLSLITIGLAFVATAVPLDAQRTKLRVALPGFGAAIQMDTLGEVVEVDAPPGRVFRAASLVLKNLQIPIDVSDSLAGLVGAAELVRTRTLARTALSRFLECGSTMTGQRADSHRIRMPLLLMMDPAPNGRTGLRIAVVGSATDNAGTSNSPVQCSSTGALEAQLRRAITAQLRELPAPAPPPAGG